MSNEIFKLFFQIGFLLNTVLIKMDILLNDMFSAKKKIKLIFNLILTLLIVHLIYLIFQTCKKIIILFNIL
jgi:hypothetical protein